MKRLLAVATGFASRVVALYSLLLILTSAAALAQSADAANAPPASSPSSTTEATSGCEPIGLTASGEIVFPFRCKDEVERHRADASKSAEPKHTAAVPPPQKPQPKFQAQPKLAVTAKPAAGRPAGVASATAEPKAPHLPRSGEAKSGEHKIGEPKTADSKSDESKPGEPKAADTKTADAQPVEPKPVEPKISEPKISEPKISEPKISEPKTSEPKTSEPKTSEPRSSEPKTAKPAKGVQPAAGAAHEHAVGPAGCTQFRSYDAVSGTYLGFDGQHHPCREVAGQMARRQVAGNKLAGNQAAHKPTPAGVTH